MDRDSKNTCLKCGGQTKKGFVQCGNRIAWVPEVSKISVEPDFNKDSVLLSKQNRLSINYVDAYLCEQCKTVLIDYSQEAE